MKKLTPRSCRDMMLAVSDKIISSENLLNEIDGATGDADHGVGMARGFTAVKDMLSKLEPQDINDVFKRCGMAMLSSMGGASGVIFSTLFMGGAMGAPSISEMDGSALAAFFSRALESIKKRGGADVGGKTMIDALAPAVSAMLEAGEDLELALQKGAEAAAGGFEATKSMVASFGRAKALGERSLGHGDAGAKSVELILCTMRDFVAQSA